ncbi:hypothetical protein LY474_33720 [Myxococcus stipitatus]|uniref:hypothetical protein n=1 Tax=Myxococcus stipitatus TaxID=83455 RepID=UPI001F230D2A|nr:hypothetical protein [Myxococcus stipitatus]MCE9672776.1 hypothetical protein [Myxococcus stipitatus]
MTRVTATCETAIHGHLNKEQIVTSTSEKITFAGTSIAGFEQVPAARFAEGVDAAFVYVNAPELGIPEGHYRVNARANEEDIQVGKYPGTVGLIDKDGKEVVKLPANIETFSLTVPDTAARGAGPGGRTQLGLQQHYEMNNDRFRGPFFYIVIYCPNGSIIYIHLSPF